MSNTDERFLVTMISAFALPDGGIATHKATDHVAKPDLDAYVEDARTRWQVVTVADEPDTITTSYDASIIGDAATDAQEG